MAKAKRTPFAVLIRRLREGLDLTQEELADRVGFHPTYISQLENGRTPNMPRRSLERYAAALQVSTDYLVKEGMLPRDNAYDIDTDTLDQDVRVLLAQTPALSVAQIRQLTALAQAMVEGNEQALTNEPGQRSGPRLVVVEEEDAGSATPLLEP